MLFFRYIVVKEKYNKNKPYEKFNYKRFIRKSSYD